MAKIMNRRKRVVTLVAAAGVTVAGTGVAFAYWTAIGEGDGTATTGQDIAFTIAVDPAEGAALTPGGPGQTVDFTVTNPSTGSQFLTGVTVTVAGLLGATFEQGTCGADDYEVVISSAPPNGEIAGGESVEGTATVTMNNLPTNQDDCQGVPVPLHFVADTAPDPAE